MNPLLAILLCAVGGYLSGATPFGYLAGKIKGIDIRQHGSGNIGATNAWRTLGPRWGTIVFLFDLLKGALPVYCARTFAGDPFHLPVAAGLAAILGHSFPCWLGFRGGKGVATSLGVVLLLAPVAAGIAAAVFAIVLGTTRIVSIGSILAAITFGACQIALGWPNPFSQNQWSLSAFSIAVPLLIVARHRANILRILQGNENRLSNRTDHHNPHTPADSDKTE
jgi:glycerol-3-phosphate acyltransferase PlsY